MKQNLFADLPKALAQEWIERLAGNQHVRIERIVSMGQASPAGFWYDQEDAEWVVLLRGKAELQFEAEDKPRQLEPGDHVLIPPHQKHRVASTSSSEPTVWLAVFYPSVGTP
jgi:cupin 2 domain-containing protein